VPFKPPPHSCNPCGTRLKPWGSDVKNG
jgi:hypothetical protein